MRVTKLLALAAVAVVAVACNGTSPTAPQATVASNDASGLVGAQALNEAIPVLGCRDITRVELRALRSLQTTRVEATYLHGDLTVQCRLGPQWSSRPQGRIARTPNPFVVRVTLSRSLSAVQVTAKAPNGVQGSILLP